MVFKPDYIRVGAFIRVAAVGTGRIVDIAESQTAIMVRIDSAKCASRFQAMDWLEYTLSPGLFEPKTLEDALKDAKIEREAVLRRIEAIDAYIERISK